MDIDIVLNDDEYTEIAGLIVQAELDDDDLLMLMEEEEEAAIAVPRVFGSGSFIGRKAPNVDRQREVDAHLLSEIWFSSGSTPRFPSIFSMQSY